MSELDDGPAGGAPGDEIAAEASVTDAFAAVEEAFLLEGDAKADGDPGEAGPIDLHPLVEQERDDYRDALQRVKAEFDNYRKRTAKADAENRERAAAHLVSELLPVLDACDAASAHDASGIGPITKMLLETLSKEGLEPMATEGEIFDPTRHDAVLHEPGDGGEPTVIESLRTGYLWKGRVLRPAMVKVRG